MENGLRNSCTHSSKCYLNSYLHLCEELGYRISVHNVNIKQDKVILIFIKKDDEMVS